MYLCVYAHVCAGAGRGQKILDVPELELQVVGATWCGYWEPSSDPLEEQAPHTLNCRTDSPAPPPSFLKYSLLFHAWVFCLHECISRAVLRITIQAGSAAILWNWSYRQSCSTCTQEGCRKPNLGLLQAQYKVSPTEHFSSPPTIAFKKKKKFKAAFQTILIKMAKINFMHVWNTQIRNKFFKKSQSKLRMVAQASSPSTRETGRRTTEFHQVS